MVGGRDSNKVYMVETSGYMTEIRDNKLWQREVEIMVRWIYDGGSQVV